MPESSDPIRAQLVEARRNQILDAATQVFAEKGFHRTRIQDVARTAGIAAGTIYNYFENKDDLLLALLGRLHEAEQRTADFAAGLEMDDVREFFTAYIRHRLSVVWPNIDLFRAALPEILANPSLRDRHFAAFIQPTTRVAEMFFHALVDAGRIRPVDVELTVRALAGAVMGLLVMQLLGDEAVAARWEALPEVLTALFFDGLAPPGDTSPS